MADLKKLKAIHSEYLKTKGLSDPKKLSWEDCRRRGIGGSDIGAICGKNKYKTAIEVFQDKTVGSSFTGNDITEFGHIMEPHIADMFATKYRDLFEVRWIRSITSARIIHGLMAILTASSLISVQGRQAYSK